MLKAAAFTYHAPGSSAEAVSLLAELGPDVETKVLAGGQSLVPLMALRLTQPDHLVDLNGLAAEIGGLDVRDGVLRIGAMVRQRAAERSLLVAAACPLLAEALPHWAHPQVRTRGTLGGSLAHADPAAEWPAIALAVDAEVVLLGPAGERRVPTPEFIHGFLSTAIAPDEILTRIDVPVPRAGTGHCFLEVSRRRGDFAMVAVAVSVAVDAGEIVTAAVALAGVAPTPVRARRCEQLLRGAKPAADVVDQAAAAVVEDILPQDDLHATAAYRRLVAQSLTRRALETAIARARS